MTHQNQGQFLKGWFSSEDSGFDNINLKKIYIDINDGVLSDGVLFSQIVYWHGSSKETGKPRMKIFKDGHLWLAKAYSEWWEECRINERTARTCVTRIKSRGLIITNLYKFDGVPTVHMRIDMEVFEVALKTAQDAIRQNKSNESDTSDRAALAEPIDKKCQIDLTPEVIPIRPNMSNGNDLKGQMESTKNGESLTETTNRDYVQGLQTENTTEFELIKYAENPIANDSPQHAQSLPAGRELSVRENQDDRIPWDDDPRLANVFIPSPEQCAAALKYMDEINEPLKVIDSHDLLDDDDLEENAIANELHDLDESRKTPPHSPPSHAAAARSQYAVKHELASDSLVSANPASLSEELGQIPLAIPSIASEAILEGEEKKGRSRKAEEVGSEQLDEEFAKFWSLYPRKIGDKPQAKKLFFLYRRQGTGFQDVLKILEIYKAQEWEGKDKKYIPYPTTWLNDKPWELLPDLEAEVEEEKAAAKAIADQEIRDRSAKLALACYREKPYRNLHFYFPLKRHVDLWTDTETKRKVFGTTRRLARPVLADWWNNLKAIGLDAIADMKILPVNEGHRLEIFGEPWKNETRTLAFSDYEGEETYFELVRKYHPFVLEQMAQERSHIDPKALTPEESAALLDEVLERSRQAAATHAVRSGWGKRIEPILEE